MTTFKTFEELEEYNKNHVGLLNSILLKNESESKFEVDYFKRITQNSQPHKVFNSDWNSYYTKELADTFLPNADTYVTKETLVYDGAEFFNDSPRSNEKVLSLSNDGKLISTAFFTYPKGVKIEQKKNTLQIENFELIAFAEVDNDNSIDIYLKFGDNFKQFLNDYYKKKNLNIIVSTVENKIYKTTVKDFKKSFSQGMVHFNQMNFLLNLLDIKYDEVAVFTITYLTVDNGKSIDSLKKEFEATVTLSDLPPNHKVWFTIDGKEFEAKRNEKDIYKMSEYKSLIEVNFSTVIANENVFALNAKLIFNNDNKVIDSKQINVKVMANGEVSETQDKVTEKVKKLKWSHSDFGNLVAQIESSDNYNICNKTKNGIVEIVDDIIVVETNIKDIQKKQTDRDIFAVGRYQLIPNTLNLAINSLNLDLDNNLDEEMQDKIFDEYLIINKRPSIIGFLEGNGTVEDAMYDAAKEWASIGVEKGKKISKNRIAVGGESYYADDGLNKALVTPEQIKESLINSKNENK